MVEAQFRHAICNELFQKTPFEQACKEIRAAGYEGIEIAPFTLAEDATTLTTAERNEIRRSMENNDLCFVGLHWLLMSPAGLHLTTRDEGVRKRSWEFLHRLIDLCADLSVCQSEYNAVMVLGSPKHRSAVDGMTPREATDILTHELAHAAPHAESRGVRILLEALSPDQTNVITSLEEAVRIIKQVGSPALQTMFDTHNAVRETQEHSELIRRYAPYIQHVHVNEMDGREPGTGDYDFRSLLTALKAAKYSGWISLEAFDFSRNSREVAEQSLNFLKKVMPEVALSSTV